MEDLLYSKFRGDSFPWRITKRRLPEMARERNILLVSGLKLFFQNKNNNKKESNFYENGEPIDVFCHVSVM